MAVTFYLAEVAGEYWINPMYERDLLTEDIDEEVARVEALMTVDSSPEARREAIKGLTLCLSELPRLLNLRCRFGNDRLHRRCNLIS